MRQFPHTKRNHRSGNWVYFRRIPRGATAGDGQKFFERSLRTGQQSRLAEAWARADREFEQLVHNAGSVAADDHAGAQNPAGGKERTPQSAYTEFRRWDGNVAATTSPLNNDLTSLRAAIKLWGDEQRFDRAENFINRPNYKSDDMFEQECVEIGACGHHRNWTGHSPKLYEITRSIIEKHEINIPPLHGSMYIAERMVEEEFRAVLEAEHRWRNFNFDDMPNRRAVQSVTPSLAPNGEAYIKFSELIDQFINSTRKPKKTRSKLKLVSRYISSIAGGDITIDLITKSVLIQLQNDALKIPARLRANEKSLSFVDLVKLSANCPLSRPRLTPQSVRSWFNLLGGCLNWAVRADLVRSNVTVGIKPVVRRNEEGSRKPFTNADIDLIFKSRTSHLYENSAKFWLPFLALYTGARLNELGQLLKDDILLEPIPAISICDLPNRYNIDKKLKNLSSRRVVPLHKNVLASGFIDFFHSVSGPHLFADLAHQSDYEPTKAFSQWFGRFLRAQGICDSGKVFHSFRHTFKDACRRVGIGEEVHDALTGHGNGKNVGRSYGAGVLLIVLAEAIQQLDFNLIRAAPNSPLPTCANS